MLPPPSAGAVARKGFAIYRPAFCWMTAGIADGGIRTARWFSVFLWRRVRHLVCAASTPRARVRRRKASGTCKAYGRRTCCPYAHSIRTDFLFRRMVRGRRRSFRSRWIPSGSGRSVSVRFDSIQFDSMSVPFRPRDARIYSFVRVGEGDGRGMMRGGWGMGRLVWPEGLGLAHFVTYYL